MAQTVGEECAVGIVRVTHGGCGRCTAGLGHGLAETQEFVASGVDLVGFGGGLGAADEWAGCRAFAGDSCGGLHAGLAVAVGVIGEADAGQWR